MTLEGNRAVVRRFWEKAFVADGDLELVDTLFASDHAAGPSSARCLHWRITSEDLRVLNGLELSVGSYAAYGLLAEISYGVGFWAIGAMIFWTNSDNWLALFLSFILVTFGALNIIEVASETHLTLAVGYAVLSFLGYVSFIVAFYLFPDGRFVPGWARWLVIACALYVAFLYFLPDDSSLDPRAWPLLLSVTIPVDLLGTMIFA